MIAGVSYSFCDADDGKLQMWVSHGVNLQPLLNCNEQPSMHGL